MIRATVTRHGQAVAIVWDDSAGKVRLSGPEAARDEVDAALQKGCHAFYNPARGGFYRGFDPADPAEVMDALTFLGRHNWDVRVHAAELPPTPSLPWSSPGGMDWNDRGVVEHELRAQQPPMRKGKPMRLIVNLRKAQQLGLFGGGRPPPVDDRAAPAPTPKPATPAPTPKPKPVIGDHPTGPGWMPIAASRHGGYHRKKADGTYEYWYPGEGERATPKDLADGFELKPQTAGTPSDGSGRRVHHDVGEKVGGARKDKWAEVHGGNLEALEAEGTSEAYKRCTKEAVLGAFDPEQARALGDTPGAAMIKAAIYRAIAPRPYVPKEIAGRNDPTGSAFSRLFGLGDERFTADSRLARAVYVSGIDKLKKALDECHTVDEVEKHLDEVKDLAINGRYETEELVTEDVARRLASAYPRAPGYGSSSTKFVYFHRGANADAAKREDRDHVEVDNNALERAGYRITSRGMHYYLRKQSPDMMDRARPNLEAIVMGERFYKGILQNRYEGAFADARREAQFYEKKDDWSKILPEGKEGAKAAEKPKAQRFVLTRGHGTPKREGGAAVPKFLDGPKFAAAFGLRAVEYGNWVDDADAGKHLEHAYGALLDLADLLQIDPKHISHGAKLAMAFGARGGGRAGAHYEPDRLIINLTHTRGGGTLAHEWGHFMDHMLAEGRSVLTPTGHGMAGASQGKTGASVHRDVHEAFREVMRAINQAPSKKSQERLQMEADHAKSYDELIAERRRLQALRGDERRTASDAYNSRVEGWKAKQKMLTRTEGVSKFAADAAMLGEYWEHPHELFARAFESWAEDKIRAKGRLNTYLVVDTDKKWNVSKTIKGELVEGLEPYPYGDERKNIHAAIDRLVDVMARTGTLRKAILRANLRRIPLGAVVHRLGAP